MSLPHAILGLLTYQPMTGYDLKRHFDHSINYFWSAQQSQIYRELAALESKGYVSSHIEPQEGRPDRKVYSISTAGEQEIQEWLERFPQLLTTPYREELLVHIFFASRLPLAELKFQLQRFIRERQEHLAAYTAVDGMISEPAKIPGHPDERLLLAADPEAGIRPGQGRHRVGRGMHPGYRGERRPPGDGGP